MNGSLGTGLRPPKIMPSNLPVLLLAHERWLSDVVRRDLLVGMVGPPHYHAATTIFSPTRNRRAPDVCSGCSGALDAVRDARVGVPATSLTAAP